RCPFAPEIPHVICKLVVLVPGPVRRRRRCIPRQLFSTVAASSFRSLIRWSLCRRRWSRLGRLPWFRRTCIRRHCRGIWCLDRREGFFKGGGTGRVRFMQLLEPLVVLLLGELDFLSGKFRQSLSPAMSSFLQVEHHSLVKLLLFQSSSA